MHPQDLPVCPGVEREPGISMKEVGFTELPKTATGKIQKFKFREKEWQSRERRVNEGAAI